MRLSRRSFVQASIVAPVFAQAIAACADDPKENLKPDPIERVSRDVHLALPQLAGWTPEEQAELVVGIGGVNFKVKQHTQESLTSALGDAASTLLGSLEFPTHWVDDAPFSAEGVQTYVVGLPDSNGVVSPIMYGVHVPPLEESPIPGLTGTLGTAGGDWLGNASPIKNDAGFLASTAEASAEWLVFNVPPIMSGDADVAAKMLTFIHEADGFDELVAKIKQKGRAISFQDAKGDGKTMRAKSGWIEQRYRLDALGNKLQELNFGGGPLEINGQPVYSTELIVNPEVQALVRVVVGNVMVLIHSDPMMEELKHATEFGSGRQELDLADPEGKLAALLGSSSASASGSAKVAAKFRYDDNNSPNQGRTFVVHHHAGNEFEIKYTSRAPVCSMTAVQPFHIDEKGNEQRTDAATLLGYVPGVYYPGIDPTFGWKQKAEYKYTLPAGTSRVELWSYTLSARPGDLNVDDTFMMKAGYPIINGVLSIVFDYVLPAGLLYLGIAGRNKSRSVKELALHVLAELGLDTLVEVAKAFVQVLAAGRNTDFLDIGGELLLGVAQKGASLAFKILAGIGLTKSTKIAEFVGKWFTQQAAQGAAENMLAQAVPIAGQALILLNIVQGAAQLAIQAGYAILTQIGLRGSLEPLHPVEVTIAPDAKVYNQFPEGAVSASIDLEAQGRRPVNVEFPFDGRGLELGVFLFPVGLELGGTLKCRVRLLNRNGEEVGAGNLEVENAKKAGELQKLSVATIPTPIQIRPTTKLEHSRKLTPTRDSRKFVSNPKGDTAGPGPGPLSCAAVSSTICDAFGISVNQTTPLLGYAFSTSTSGQIRTQVHLTTPKIASGVAASVERYAGGGLAFGRVLLPKTTGRGFLIGEVPPGELTPATNSMMAMGEDTVFGVYEIDVQKPKLPSSFAKDRLLATFFAPTIQRAKLHSAGVILAITGGAFFESLEPAAVAGYPATSRILAKRGDRQGQLRAPVSLAPKAAAHELYLLEGGALPRVQCLDFYGNPVVQFGGDAAFDLRTESGRTFLDIEEDAIGNIWVLSRGNNYQIDVYSAAGAYIVTFKGVNALSFAIDDASTVYCLNSESVVGPADYPEPSISLWTPINLRA
jgi:hypothetical protein